MLIRHGQPEWVRDGLNVVDPPLTELGHRQASALAPVMAAQELDEVLVSPLLRARQTAAPVLEALGRDEDIDMPRVPAAPGEPDPHSKRLRHVSDMDATPISAQQVRDARHAYYGAVSYVDEQIVFRQVLCPGCATALLSQVVPVDHPLPVDTVGTARPHAH